MDAASRGTSYVYGIERHTLCLASLTGDTSNNRFALGTLGITEPGEIHVVDFRSDENTLQSTVYNHTSGVRALASTPWDPSHILVVNCGRTSASSNETTTTTAGSPTSSSSLSVSAGAAVELVALSSDQEHGPENETQRIALLQPAAHTESSQYHQHQQRPVPPHAVVCHPATHSKRAAVVSTASVTIWDLSHQSEDRPAPIFTVSASTQPMTIIDDIGTAAWHPTNTNQFSTTDSTCIRTWDTRVDVHKAQGPATMATAVDCAHSAKIRALNYNPNLPYILASGGDDGAVRIWDLRNPATALLELANHSHWVYSVEFNPNHDQLLLSAGSDGLVNLESAVSVSSAHVVAGIGGRHSDPDASTSRRHQQASALDNIADKPRASDAEHTHAAEENSDSDTDDNEGAQRPVDGLVSQFDDHETSVYAAHWSAADPWLFASLSFDGRMVINFVPREEKYKILL
ncbi:Protein tssc1 [Coemansia sp. RSA 1939]|nr:Protein tssc1 [Coemansia sp. RSA 1939]KAJ2590133.1 Protein tssc1 [Coemansia sp. RSA 1804]KAJ2655020.1 Protein tssc1 [Coemansia sp. RSA 1285]